MQNDTYIQTKIEKALSSIDNLQRAEPRPFFYTRLVARLTKSKQNSWEKYSVYITRPSTAFAGILLVIMMNIIAAYSDFKNPVTEDTDQSEVTASTTADEYAQENTNFYDFENMKP